MDVGEENGVNILAVVQVLDILFGLEVVVGAIVVQDLRVPVM